MDRNAYETAKLLYCIMFNSFDSNYADKEELFDLLFIEMLKETVKNYAESCYLSNSVKNNVNNFLSAARSYKDENRDKRIELINDTIRIMNGQKQDNSIEFYRVELALRRNDNKYLTKYPDHIIKSQMSALEISICHDYLVIYSHGQEVTDEQFVNQFLSDFVTSPLYYESINAILEENPSIFKDLTFYNRMICVLNLYQQTYNNKDTEKYNKKLVKKVNKELKKLN